MEELDYQKIIDNLPILIYVKEANNIDIAFFNKHWKTVIGITVDEINADRYNLIHPDDKLEALKTLLYATKHKEAYSTESRVFSKIQNKYLWLISKCRPIFDASGNIKWWIGVSTDITDVKESYQFNKHVYETEVFNKNDIA